MKLALNLSIFLLGISSVGLSQTTDQRTTAVQAAKIQRLEQSSFMVGSVQVSILNQEQFQTLMGSADWVLMDGRSIKGTRLAKLTGMENLPDASGRFFRMAGGNAASLGAVQGQATALNGLSNAKLPIEVSGPKNQFNHNHEAYSKFYAGLGPRTLAPGGSSFFFPLQGTDNLNQAAKVTVISTDFSGQSFRATGTADLGRVQGGDVETRPINLSVNYFIKVN